MSELMEKLVREVVALRERVNALEVLEQAAGISDHGALSGLADDDHPQYAKADDLTAHADASNGVHGLAAGVHVLGTQHGAGFRIECKSSGGATYNNSAGTQSVTWDNAFSAVSIALMSLRAGTNLTSTQYGTHGVMRSWSTTGATMSFAHRLGSNMNLRGDCIAIGR